MPNLFTFKRLLSLSAGLPPAVDSLESSGLLSPSSTVRSITRELQHSLDLASATSGEKVVTARVRLETQPLSLTFSCQNPARVSRGRERPYLLNY